MADDVDLTIVTMRFEASDRARLEAVLARYVVASRGHQGCRNIDLCSSISQPGRYLVIEKWESPEAQRAHFDSEEMVEMARSCEGILAGPPDIELLAAVSAHDLW
jgi:quinol monooxygenase YgiN